MAGISVAFTSPAGISAERSGQMLRPHAAEPRMGSGVFLATSARHLDARRAQAP